MEITFRGIRPEDGELIRGWRNLPEVARYMYTDHYITPQEHEQWLQRLLQDRKQRLWVISGEGEDLGAVNLYEISMRNKRAYWAFYISHPRVRGKGVGSFVEYWALRHVFEELHLNRLCCEVLASNRLVIEMHKSFGFMQEGYFRRHVIKKGNSEDVVSLAILEEEWKQVRPQIEERLKRKGFLL